MTEPKRFDDYLADCNECQHYWNDTCDGAKPHDTRPCTSFKATRKVDIPEQIKKLDNEVKVLKKCYVFLTFMYMLFHLILHILV